MSEFPPLPSARAEAERVAALLKDATVLVGTAAETNLRYLRGARWRVLHIAARGAVDFATQNGRASGIVLWEGLFLTPELICQLPQVPDLVFLNFCGASERKAEAHYPELAAILATAFVKMGARAVVAAGWAVDDRAAGFFTETFYQKLQTGESFGNAVYNARRSVYVECPMSVAWGAYQCYGYYDFVLIV